MKKFLIGLTGVIFAFMSSLAFAQAGAIEDAEIISILKTVNKGEIDAAKRAQTKASNPEVRKYAQLMIADHEKAAQATAAVAKAAKATTINSEYSRSLKKENDQAMRKMKKLQGNAFDQAYMDSQIQMHQKVLQLIDSTLLPSARNPQLKALITDIRPVIESHWQQAKQIRSAI